MYKLSLKGGMTCPNRDGTLSSSGCIFCSVEGSGDFAVNDIEKAKLLVSSKYSGDDYIAYFQSFTNTYADIDYLRNLYMPVITRDDIRILSIATRPDCLSNEVLKLLEELNSIKPVWVELGLQTINPDTAAYIRRGYDLETFDEAVSNLLRIGIKPIIHMIVGLPGETLIDYVDTARYISDCGAFGIKIALLHVLKGTDLYNDFKAGRFDTLTMDEYFEVLKHILPVLRKDLVVHRLTGDGPKSILVSPLWTSDKKNVLNSLNSYLKDNNIIQGSGLL